MYKVVLAVIASRGEIYDRLVETYWKRIIDISEKRGDVKIILMYGCDQKAHELNIPESNLFVGSQKDSLWPGIISKTIECLRHINRTYKYDHIIRTNLSSFFILDKLVDQGRALRKERCYAGIYGKHFNQEFCSGACFWLSRCTSEYLVDNCHEYMWNISSDDVVVGMIMEKYGVKPQPLGRFDFTCNHYYLSEPGECEHWKGELLKNHYHVRIKNENDRNMDVLYMAKLTEMFYPEVTNALL